MTIFSFPLFIFAVFTLRLITGFSSQNLWTLTGYTQSQHIGRAISGVADINQDGYDDILVGSQYSSPNGINLAGEVYLIYGGPGTDKISIPSFNLSNIDGNNGVSFYGYQTGGFIGASVSGAGDVNNDGYPDFMFGGPHLNSYTGYVFLVYGSSNPNSIPSPVNVSSITGSYGVQFIGENLNDYIGAIISSAGDLNNDGFSDLLFSSVTKNATGVVYVVYGSSSLPSLFNLSTINGSNGFIIECQDFSDNCGSSIAPIGDFNFDGYHDILIGAPSHSSNGNSDNGASYIIFGNSSHPHHFLISNLDGSNGIQFNGNASSDQVGHTADGLGDINNDGYSDILISSYRASVDGNALVGEVYLIYGGSSVAHPFNLSSINGSQGVTFKGFVTESGYTPNFGYSLSGPGDVNNDGIPDILIGAPFSHLDGINLGVALLVYGKTAFEHPFQLSKLTNADGLSHGLIYYGPSDTDQFGFNVASLGDINNDTSADFIIGAPYYEPPTVSGISNTGGSFIVLGTSNVSGHYWNTTNLSKEPCNPGSYQIIPPYTLSECSLCPPASYQPGFGQDECISCSIGTYEEGYGKTQCTSCPPGTIGVLYSSDNKNSACIPCDPGFYNPLAGQTSCISCPAHSFCSNVGTFSIIPDAGYQLVQGDLLPCYPTESCPGGKLNECSPGYTNPQALCSVCDTGYSKLHNRCVPCSPASSVLIILWQLIILASFVFISTKSFKDISKFLQIFQIFQTMALISFIKVPESTKIWRFIFDFLSAAFLFNIEYTECNSTFVSSNLFQLMLPFIALLIIASSVYLISKQQFIPLKYFEKSSNIQLSPISDPRDTNNNDAIDDVSDDAIDNTCKKNKITQNRLLNEISDMNHLLKSPFQLIKISFFIVLYTMYPISTYTALSSLSCTDMGSSLVLDSRPSIQCFSTEWWSVSWASILSTLIYTIGFPIYIFQNTKTPNTNIPFSIFKFYYLPKYSWFETVKIFKIGMILLITILSWQITLQGPMTILIFLCFDILVISSRVPYISKQSLFIHYSNNMVLILLLFFAMFESLSELSILVTLVVILYPLGISIILKKGLIKD